MQQLNKIQKQEYHTVIYTRVALQKCISLNTKKLCKEHLKEEQRGTETMLNGNIIPIKTR